MTDDKFQSIGPRHRLRDHGRELGSVRDSLERRRVAVAADIEGRTILVRPDSVLVDGQANESRRRGIREAARRVLKDASIVELTDSTDADLIRIPVTPRRGGTGRWSAEPVDELVDALRDFGAQPNHVVTTSPSMAGSPAALPMNPAGDVPFPGHSVTATDAHGVAVQLLLNTSQPADAPAGLRSRREVDRRPRVLVVDTGLRTRRGAGKVPEHPALADCDIHQLFSDAPGVDAADDEDEPSADGFPGILDYGSGHGTFVTGVVRQLCPDADITTSGALNSFCDGDEVSVIRALARIHRLVRRRRVDPFDIIVMSLGGYRLGDTAGTLGTAIRSLADGALVVAAAGNESSTRKVFPAAMPDVVGVGALGPDGRAWFSNHGDWVDACAPGVDVVSTYFTEFPKPKEASPLDPRRYDGWAMWSGTSFSTPKVAAEIANDMIEHGGSAHEAWARLSAPGVRPTFADLGVVFDV